jgi:TonB family protein
MMLQSTIRFMAILSSLLTMSLFIAGPLFQAVRITEQPVPGLIPPLALASAKPFYTREALSAHIEGSVTVQVRFDADGNFRVLQLVQGLGYGLDENALAALQQWRFAPALSNGLAVSVIANVAVDFRSSDGQSCRSSLAIRLSGQKCRFSTMGI